MWKCRRGRVEGDVHKIITFFKMLHIFSDLGITDRCGEVFGDATWEEGRL